MEIQLTHNATFYPNARKVVVNGSDIQLTKKETGLLNFLYRNKNEVSSRSEVLTEIWGDNNYFNGRSMDVYVCRLRKILNALNDIEIISVRGKGHKLIIAESKEVWS